MTRYEIKKDRFEFRFGRYKGSIPSMTADEVFSMYLTGTANDPETVGSYDTKEEALAALEQHKHDSVTYPQAGFVFWLLVGEVVFIEINEYDEDGEFDMGGDILKYSACGYEKED